MNSEHYPNSEHSQISLKLSWRLAVFVKALDDGKLTHPLLLTRELHALLEMAWEEAEAGLQKVDCSYDDTGRPHLNQLAASD